MLIDRRAADTGDDTATTEPLDSDQFRSVLGRYPTGVTAITALEHDGTPVAMTVGTFTSVSLDPPLVAFFPDKKSTSFPRIRERGTFCVNVLSAEQGHLGHKFARSATDKFEGVPWRRSPAGSPLIEGVCAWIDCELETVIDAGDHYAVIARVRGLDIESNATPLVFHGRRYGRVVPLVPDEGD